MADERFEVLYDFQVRDERLHGTARALNGMNDALDRGTKRLQGFEGAYRDASGRLREANGRFMSEARKMELGATGAFEGIGKGARRARAGVVDLAAAMSIAGTALRVAGSVAGATFGAFERFGEQSLQAFGERSSTVRGYTTFLNGDRRQAELEFYRAQDFAQKTDFSSETVEKAQSRLLAQGFRGQDLYASLFSAADLAAAAPGDKNETLSRLTLAMSQVRAKGKLQGEELNQQFAEAGLNTTLVREEIRKSMGLKTIGDVDKRISAGEVSADVALPAIQRAILEQLHTSRAGEFATGSAGSLTSLISNRDEAIKNLLKSFDADEALPAMQRYKDVLREQGEAFSATSATGRNLALVIQDLGNQSIHASAGWDQFKTGFLEAFSANYVDELRKLDPKAIQGAGGGINDVAASFGRLGALAPHIVHSLDSITESLGGFFYDPEASAAAFDRKMAAAAEKRAEEEAKIEADVRQKAMGFLYQKGLVYDPDVYPSSSTLDILNNKSAQLKQLYGPPSDLAPKVTDKPEASKAKKGKAEAGWNVLLTNYEPWFNPGSSGINQSVEGARAINSMVESNISASMQQRSGGTIQQLIQNIYQQPGQSPQELADVVTTRIMTELRGLSRAPTAKR